MKFDIDFRKRFFDKIQLIKIRQELGAFTRRPVYMYENISLISSQIKKDVHKIKAHILHSIIISEKPALYEIMWEKNVYR
jgi:hypothetical protein